MQARQSIQAVSFDVGGTLIEPWPSVGHVYAAVAVDHGHRGISPATLDRQFAEAWKRKTGFDHSRSAWRALVQQTFTGLRGLQVWRSPSPLPPGALGSLAAILPLVEGPGQRPRTD